MRGNQEKEKALIELHPMYEMIQKQMHCNQGMAKVNISPFTNIIIN
jgi:hypothetical protein